MDYTFIAAALQNQWNMWNIRGFMIVSLCMQLLLAVVAPYRQLTSHRFVIFVVWSAYLLADWAAMFVFGLISNTGCRNLENNGARLAPDVLAFWAAFLLVHLGGPDTITAFSMEDNALWMRHLVGLIAQLSVFTYIFLKTLPNNRLLVPTILIFVTGVINYGERTRALYLASLENLKKTIEKGTVQEQTEGTDIFHKILKGLVVDIVPDLQESNKSRAVILGLRPWLILEHILMELNRLYELLYTKIKAANSSWGMIARAIAYYCTLVAFILFYIGHKHDFLGGDLVITYALFAGVLVLHLANTITFMRSPFTSSSLKGFILSALWQGILPPLVIMVVIMVIANFPASSAVHRYVITKWSKKMASFNILSDCFKQSTLRKGRKLGFIWNKLAGERNVSKEDIDPTFWSLVSKDIMENVVEAIDTARTREIYEARGDRVLRRIGCDRLMPYIESFQYEETLMIWHIATEICINMEAGEDYMDSDDRKMKRIFSKKLSDYMMYLLVRRTKLMSAVAGINHIRYKDTCAELKLLGRKSEVPTMREFCESILRERAKIIEPDIEEKPNVTEENNHADISEPTIIENSRSNISELAIEENNHGFSVLKDSCGLVELLKETNNRWEVIYKVWVELLSFAAGHCRADAQARVLSEGNEFITVVWVLMSLCGIGDHFPANRPKA